MIVIIKNSTGPFLANQTKKEEAGPVEFLHFRAYNLVHPIIPYYRDEPNPEYEP